MPLTRRRASCTSGSGADADADDAAAAAAADSGWVVNGYGCGFGFDDDDDAEASGCADGSAAYPHVRLCSGQSLRWHAREQYLDRLHLEQRNTEAAPHLSHAPAPELIARSAALLGRSSLSAFKNQ